MVGDAVRADGRDVLADKPFADALQRLTRPTPLLTAPAGMFGAPPPVLSHELVATWTERVSGAAPAGSPRGEPLHDHVRPGGRRGGVPGHQGSGPLVTQLTEARTAGSFGTLTGLVASGGVLVLSGAGLSTESGIPDYRGPTGLARRATPMTYQDVHRRAPRPGGGTGPAATSAGGTSPGPSRTTGTARWPS